MGFWDDLFDLQAWQNSLQRTLNDPNPANATGNLWGSGSQYDKLGKDSDNPLRFLGLTQGKVDPNAPGGTLDTSGADEERARLGPLLEQLQQQATTGGGAWEGALKDATGKASSAAMALGQSMPGQSYQSQLQNIGNTQGAVGQRAAGQANILRAESKQAGQDQLAQLLGGMGGQDASQSADAASAAQGVRDLNASLGSQARAGMGQTIKGTAQALTSLSDGGSVPGTPEVFGDDEKNDTVPAWLSPGEIVIPISHAGSPEAAAEFVRSLHASRGVQHFDAGGTAGDGSGITYHPTGLFDSDVQAPSVENGGLLDTTTYDANRAAVLQNSNALAGRAAGKGPSVAPQVMQNSVDSNIGAAMAAANQPHGAPAADVLQATGAATQGAAGNAAATVGNEQAQGQKSVIRALLEQRAQDAALALAKQQAAFKNTQMNAGLDIAQQAQLRGIFGGAGQGLAGYAAASGGGSGALPANTPSFDTASSWDRGAPSDPSEWQQPFAKGGEVHGKSTASARPSTWAPRRGARVDVQPLEPTQMLTVHQPDYKPSQRLRPYASEDEEPEFQPQLAHGGQVDPDELDRAADFLSSLKRARRAA